jgi:hypothetical protein
LAQPWQASERFEQSMVEAAQARNLYLLSVIAFNAQLAHYHEADLAEYVRVMDGDYHARMLAYITSYTSVHRAHAEREIATSQQLEAAAGRISQVQGTSGPGRDLRICITDLT